MTLETLRRYLPLGVFLGFYTLTTIVGNLIYTTPWGQGWPAASIIGFSWDRFRVGFGVGYWTLLLFPLVLMPPVAILTGGALRSTVLRLEWLAADFPKPVFIAIVILLFGYVALSLAQADALSLLVAASDAISAVENRFEVLSRLGFWPVVVMQSPLVFLTVYSVVKASRTTDHFWIVAATLQTVALTACLILLNMKWPAVLFIVTVGFAIFVCAQTHAILKAGIVTMVGVAMYLLISTVLLHFEPVDTPRTPVEAPKVNTVEKTARTVKAAKDHTPLLLMVAVNRMAMSTPYYYDVFSAEGQVCGTIGDRILRRTNPCHPSTLIYERMFGADGFQGKGTAPAAIQISGFALGGWPGAVLSLFAGSIVIGGFLSLWPAARWNDLVAASFVMGGYTAYFFTQLPFEGPLIYSHGLWWVALIPASSIFLLAKRRLA